MAGHAPVRIVVRNERDLTVGERAASDALRAHTWPATPDYAGDPDYRNPLILWTLLYHAELGDDLAGTALIHDCRLTITGTAVAAAGLGGVVVDERLRGRGLGAPLVRAALAGARERGYMLGALFCRAERRAFYARLGWETARGPITKTLFGVEQPIRPGGLFMLTPLTPAAAGELPAWRDAPIHVGVGQW